MMIERRGEVKGNNKMKNNFNIVNERDLIIGSNLELTLWLTIFSHIKLLHPAPIKDHTSTISLALLMVQQMTRYLIHNSITECDLKFKKSADWRNITKIGKKIMVYRHSEI